METKDITGIELKFLDLNHYQELKTTMISAYANMQGSHSEQHHIESLINNFTERQVVIKIKGQLAGCALPTIVDYDEFEDSHTCNDITGDFSFPTNGTKAEVTPNTEMILIADVDIDLLKEVY